MRAVCSGTGGIGCCGWSDMAKPPAITAPTPLSTLRLTYSPTVSYQWWEKAEQLWLANRSSERLTLTEQLDYQSKLSKQFPLPSLRVVYNRAGMHITAAKIA